MNLILLISILFSLNAFATGKAPADFAFKDGQAVFVDFINVEYKIVVDFDSKASKIISIIEFRQDKVGYPIFDIRTKILSLKIDHQPSIAPEITPPGAETQLRVVNTKIGPGLHTLEVESDIAEFKGGIDFNGKSLKFDFLLSDLSDREFFEIWGATNLEYDQYPLVFDFSILNSPIEHRIYHNGSTLSDSNNHFRVEFPAYFNTSAPYIDIAPTNAYPERSFTLRSKSGRDIPVLIYSTEEENVESLFHKAEQETIKVFHEMEANIGLWPHPQLLIQIYEGSGGMEYHGATISGIEDLRHELIHSYFARGVMPMDGKSSWIDEAITEWITHEYKSLALPCSVPSVCSLKIDEYPPYIRHTELFYPHGEAFIAYLNQKFSDKGGMLPFLSWFFMKYNFTPITTEILKSELELYFSTDLTHDFETYIYN